MIYLFQHPESGEYRDVWFEVNDNKVFVDESGVKWERVFTPPQISVDTKIDPRSKDQFLRKTNRQGTVGDLMDFSAEMSERRKEKDGVDFVKEAYEAKEDAFRGGKKRAKKLKDIEVEVKVK